MNTKTVKAGQRRSPLADLYTRPGFLFRRANQILMYIAEQETAEIGLTPPQHVCLIVLNRCAALDQISLGKAIGMDRATVGQVIRRLETRGLVRRTTAPGDARRRVVALTAQGRKLVAPADAAAINVSKRMLASLAPDEKKQLVALLSKVVAALDGESPTPIEPPPPIFADDA
jgi:DNA-binding MarR family transcriptional regulator